jgi:hypothetical protein
MDETDEPSLEQVQVPMDAETARRAIENGWQPGDSLRDAEIKANARQGGLLALAGVPRPDGDPSDELDSGSGAAGDGAPRGWVASGRALGNGSNVERAGINASAGPANKQSSTGMSDKNLTVSQGTAASSADTGYAVRAPGVGGSERWGDDPSLKRIPNSDDRVKKWLDEANVSDLGPMVYLMNARNVYVSRPTES